MRSKKKLKAEEMKSPSDVLLELSDRSLEIGQSLEDWRDYLNDMRSEVDMKIATVENDLEAQRLSDPNF